MNFDTLIPSAVPETATCPRCPEPATLLLVQVAWRSDFVRGSWSEPKLVLGRAWRPACSVHSGPLASELLDDTHTSVITLRWPKRLDVTCRRCEHGKIWTERSGGTWESRPCETCNGTTRHAKHALA